MFTTHDFGMRQDLCGRPDERVIDCQPQPAHCFVLRPARINGVGSACPSLRGADSRIGKQTLDIRDALRFRKRRLVEFNLIALLERAHQFHPVQRAEIQFTLERNRTLRGSESCHQTLKVSPLL